MSIITFMSDFGLRDHYVAAVKAKILSLSSDIQIVDISHEIEDFNISHAAFVLSAVFRDFPQGTVHIVAVSAQETFTEKFIAVELEGHFFVGTDNGIFSLISDVVPTKIIFLNEQNAKSNTFSAKTLMAPIAVELAKGVEILTLGTEIPLLNKKFNRQIKVTRNTIGGNVIHIDHFGNLITNISKEAFEPLRDKREFTVTFRRQNINTIHSNYTSVDEAECAIFFNSLDFLEIAINKGNASQLLGMEYDGGVIVEFFPAY